MFEIKFGKNDEILNKEEVAKELQKGLDALNAGKRIPFKDAIKKIRLKFKKNELNGL